MIELDTPLITWSKTTKIRIGNLPAKLEDLQALAIASAPYYVRSYLVSYVRHRLTNYHNLLDFIDSHGYTDAPRCAAEILHERVNSKIEVVLDRRYGEKWR